LRNGFRNSKTPARRKAVFHLGGYRGRRDWREGGNSVHKAKGGCRPKHPLLNRWYVNFTRTVRRKGQRDCVDFQKLKRRKRQYRRMSIIFSLKKKTSSELGGKLWAKPYLLFVGVGFFCFCFLVFLFLCFFFFFVCFLVFFGFVFVGVWGVFLFFFFGFFVFVWLGGFVLFLADGPRGSPERATPPPRPPRPADRPPTRDPPGQKDGNPPPLATPRGPTTPLPTRATTPTALVQAPKLRGWKRPGV